MLEGIECLYSPGVWTGQKGSGAALMAVEKIGCEVNIPKVRYTCMFSQSIRINMPGGENLGQGGGKLRPYEIQGINSSRPGL